jgi:formate dehydrogenase subunit delta
MDIDNLVRMANQIGGFFSAYPDREEALEGIATHIHKFWEPRMRLLILSHLSVEQTPDMLPLVRDSLSLHAARLRPNMAAAAS